MARRGPLAADVRAVAAATGLPVREVRAAVLSAASALALRVRRLPFASARRIYSPAAFAASSFVALLPGLGRVGPAYSRYVRWRATEASGLELRGRAEARRMWRSLAAEEEAARVLAGGEADVARLRGRVPASFARPVWLVGAGGRRLARQSVVACGRRTSGNGQDKGKL